MSAGGIVSTTPARRALRLIAASAITAAVLAGSMAGCATESTTTQISAPPTSQGTPVEPPTTRTSAPLTTETSAPPTTEGVPAVPPMPTGARDQALQMLLTYGLVVEGEPELFKEGTLGPADQGFILYSDLSASIGLDLASHEGQSAQWYSFPLKQRSEEEGRLSAVFVVSESVVIGAGLHFRHGVPGVAPLDDKNPSD